MMDGMPRVGTLLGRFQIERELRERSIGAIYRAFDVLLETPVALKVMSPALERSEAFRRLSRELKLSRQVVHPSVCRVFDIHEVDQWVFLSMEYTEGPSLEELSKSAGPLPIGRAARLVGQIASALAAAHAQEVLHRELSLGNVVVRALDRVTILGFGQSLARDAAYESGATSLPERIHFIAPEVLAGGQSTALSDIYSLGVILYRTVTGALPFQGQNLGELTDAIRQGRFIQPHLLNAEVRPSLARVIGRTMAHCPEERFPSALEVGDALKTYALDMWESQEMFLAPVSGDLNENSTEELTQQIRMRKATLLLSDIVGITQYFERFGDMAGRRRIQRHNELVFPVIQHRRGRVIKTIGDAIMAHFQDADDAVEAAIGIQQAIYRQNQAAPDNETQIHVGVGLHTGQCIIENQDIFGDSVNVASRVSSLAQSSEILLSEATFNELERTSELAAFSEIASLKGKSGEVRLYSIRWHEVELSEPPALPLRPPAPTMPEPVAWVPIELFPDPLPDFSSDDTGLPPALYIPEMDSTSDSTDESARVLPFKPGLLTPRNGPTGMPSGEPQSWLRSHRLPIAIAVGLLALGVVVGFSMQRRALDPLGVLERIAISDPRDTSALPKDPAVDFVGGVPRPRSPSTSTRHTTGAGGESSLRATILGASGTGQEEQGVRPPPAPEIDPAWTPSPPRAQEGKEIGKLRDGSSDPAVQRMLKMRQSIQEMMRARGLLPGDAPSLDADLARISDLSLEGKTGQALMLGRRALLEVRDFVVDRDFVQAKLLRFNQALALAPQSTSARISPLAEEIVGALTGGHFEKANGLINQSFDLLERR